MVIQAMKTTHALLPKSREQVSHDGICRGEVERWSDCCFRSVGYGLRGGRLRAGRSIGPAALTANRWGDDARCSGSNRVENKQYAHRPYPQTLVTPYTQKHQNLDVEIPVETF